MCYYLYGSLYGNVPESEYESIQKKYEYKFARGTKHDIKNAVKASAEYVEDDFRITDWICDCDSPVGKHDSNDPMILDLCNLITELSSLPGVKQINISKTWAGSRNKKETVLKLTDIDLAAFLADLQENCLYSLNL